MTGVPPNSPAPNRPSEVQPGGVHLLREDERWLSYQADQDKKAKNLFHKWKSSLGAAQAGAPYLRIYSGL